MVTMTPRNLSKTNLNITDLTERELVVRIQEGEIDFIGVKARINDVVREPIEGIASFNPSVFFTICQYISLDNNGYQLWGRTEPEWSTRKETSYFLHSSLSEWQGISEYYAVGTYFK
jgi:hypothetical protein